MTESTPRFNPTTRLIAAEKRWRAEPDLTTAAIRERFGLSNSTAAELSQKLRAEGVLPPLNVGHSKNPMTRLM